MSLVSLELDEKDKENFQELQQSMAQAQGELSNLTTKLRTRGAEAKHSQLILKELEAVPDETRSYTQVGKMFLLQPLPELKKKLSDKTESCVKEVAAITEKREHVEEVQLFLFPLRAAACSLATRCMPPTLSSPPRLVCRRTRRCRRTSRSL